MENKIAEKFIGLQFNESFIEKIINEAKEVFYNRRKLYEAKRQNLVNQRTAFESKRKTVEDKLFDKVISNEDYTRIRNDLSTELATIDKRMQELEVRREAKMDIAQEIIHFTRAIYDAYTKASPHLKRKYLGFFWERFEMRNGVIISNDMSPQ